MIEIPCPPDKEYLQHQIDAILRMAGDEFDNILIADEMGVGKTIEALGYINLTKPEKVLITCPNTLRINWEREAESWLVDKYQISQCTSNLFIPPDIEDGPYIVIASFEGIKKYYPILSTMGFNLHIVDEVHFCKNPDADRTKATFKIIAQRKFGMSGAPIPNYPYELFTIAHWLDPKAWPDFPSFESRYCYGQNNKWGRNLLELQSYLRFGKPEKPLHICANCSHRDYSHTPCTCPNHVGQHCKNYDYLTKDTCKCENYTETAKAATKPLMIRRLKKEVLAYLPKKRRQVIEIPADGRMAELVKLEKMLWDSAEGKGVYTSILQQLNFLKEGDTDEEFEYLIEGLTLSRGYIFSEIAKIRHQLAVAKIPFVIDHLENVLESENKIVVFFHHYDVRKQLYEHFKEPAGAIYIDGSVTNILERDHRKEQFQTDEKCRILIGSMRVAGYGLTFTASHNIVFAEFDWSPSVLTQCEDRCHRIGQEHKLLIQHLIIQGSMDSFMSKKVINKQRQSKKALDDPIPAEKISLLGVNDSV